MKIVSCRASEIALLMGLTFDFQPLQIVFLEHEATRLYAEVIQIVESRQLCWVRPLMLVVLTAETSQPSKRPSLIYDLRSSSDLLWPVHLFRPAFDTEVTLLLTEILASEPQLDRNPADTQQFNQFIHQVWRQTAFHE